MEIERMLRSLRGRWMVVDGTGGAYRYARRSQARQHIESSRRAGFPAHLRRWRRDRVVFVNLGYEVNDRRWCP